MKEALERRLSILRQRLSDSGIDALLIMDPLNRVYISGFRGSAGDLLVTADGAWLLTDFRYVEAATGEAPCFEVLRCGPKPEEKPFLDHVRDILSSRNINRLSFEAAAVTYKQYETLKTACEGVELQPSEGIVEGLRVVKDEGEISLIRKAVALAEEAYKATLPLVKPGVSEREIALELEILMRRKGAEGAAFDFIVAAGERGALPHGLASDRLIREGDMVVLDFGARYQGYHSDMTRTVFVGGATERQQTVYEVVLRAQEAALDRVRPGVTGAEVDAAARDIIEAAGYGANFGHGTGHGVGLNIHEGPRLSRTGSEEELQAGMVVTVEPGIYIPGWGGVRIEDTVLVTSGGCEVLCRTGKGLTII